MGQLYPPPSHSSWPPHITVFSFMHAGEADLARFRMEAEAIGAEAAGRSRTIGVAERDRLSRAS